MIAARRVLTLLLALGWAVPALGQFQGSDAGAAPGLGETVVTQWRFGVVVTAGSGPCRGIVATTSVPTDWPEQEVRLVAEEFSPGVHVTYDMLEGAVKQMTARIASLAPGEEARAVATFQIKRRLQIPPPDPDALVLPDPKGLDRKLRAFLAPSPYIESNSPEVKALAEKIGVDQPMAWGRVEAIYDWVRQNIQFQDNRGGAVKTTLQTLRDGAGDCDEMTSLFIAICRAGGIPARTVRVPGHCYPEFYLEDAAGQGRWFPCQAAGTRAFGAMPDPRPVLQKGDHLRLRDPSTRKTRDYRFLPDNLIIADARGSPPQVKVVLKQVAP